MANVRTIQWDNDGDKQNWWCGSEKKRRGNERRAAVGMMMTTSWVKWRRIHWFFTNREIEENAKLPCLVTCWGTPAEKETENSAQPTSVIKVQPLHLLFTHSPAPLHTSPPRSAKHGLCPYPWLFRVPLAISWFPAGARWYFLMRLHWPPPENRAERCDFVFYI